MREATALPNRLREVREAAGLTQADLAARVGVSKQSISDLELGEKVPSLERAAAIARVLGQTVDALFLAGTSTEPVDNQEQHAGEIDAPASLPAPSSLPGDGAATEAVDNSEPVA